MAIGQQVLSPGCDVEALRAACAVVEASTTARSASHAMQLRGVLAVDRVFSQAGMDLSSIAQVALLLHLPERSAHVLLEQARLLDRLDGALDALDIGLLTVEQARAVWVELDGRDPVLQDRVWVDLTGKLLDAVSAGVVLSRARLVEWLRRRVIAADPADAIARRKQAQQYAAEVEYRRREDGLVDLFGLGLSGPNARAILQRIRARSGKFGAQDDRPVGQRRLQAFTDLLLGRDSLPLGPVDDDNPFHQPDSPCDQGHLPPGGAGPCGCRLGEPMPCGLGVTVLVPLGAALGTTGELAELEGHGPIEPDLLAAALANAPVLRAVYVDADGSPVAIGDQTVTPARRDPLALRQALLNLAGSAPPGPPHPRHPDDHPPADAAAGDDDTMSAAAADEPPGDAPSGTAPADGAADQGHASTPAAGPGGGVDAADGPPGADARRGRVRGWSLRPAWRYRAHPTGTPGAYRPRARLQRLVRARSPRCEWPACGAAAVRCDFDHDLAWPAGPTCACNLGALCRRHHRCKQQLMSKQRTPAGVRWSDPTGREWLSPHQHTPPQPQTRPMALLLLADPDRDQPDDDAEDEGEDDRTDLDPIRLELRATDPYERTAEEQDDLAWADDRRRVERLIHPDGYGWAAAALDDATRWEPHPDPTDPTDPPDQDDEPDERGWSVEEQHSA